MLYCHNACKHANLQACIFACMYRYGRAIIIGRRSSKARPLDRLGLWPIAAEGVGHGGVQGEHAVQARDPKNALDRPVGADQVNGLAAVILSKQTSVGADQDAKPHRIHEVHLAQVEHDLAAPGGNDLVQAVAQLWRASDVDLAAHLHDGMATSGADMQVEMQRRFRLTVGRGIVTVPGAPTWLLMDGDVDPTRASISTRVPGRQASVAAPVAVVAWLLPKRLLS